MDSTTSKSIKLVTFKIASHWFALPMANVLKIVNCPSPSKGSVILFGVVQLGNHTIQLLDLYGTFGLGTNAKPPVQPQFLLVLRMHKKTLWGIVLEAPPDLIELPLDLLKSISVDQRFVPRKQWISHIAVVSEQTIKRTLLLLDLKAVFKPETMAA
ncbi:MAG: chemotaxis protein CheW [Leptolyngbya sp. SIO3F4]|nr:chemotaxis protein CheW [Leptolyngbya sp. SIO3F4]